MLEYRCLIFTVAIIISQTTSMPAGAAEPTTNDAWLAVPRYEYGQDMAPLLTAEREIIASMNSPQARSACAARLSALLGESDTTPAARQWICLQLRQVGTATEVPILKKLLCNPENAEMARYALESIPGPEATEALRAALTSSQGQHLIGVIGSVAKRRDKEAISQLQKLADSADPQVATAAVRGLGDIADEASCLFLLDRAEKAGEKIPQSTADALLRCASAGQHATTIDKLLSQPGLPSVTRRAALEGLLKLQGENAETTILSWFGGEDADRRQIAAGHLYGLSDERLDHLLGRLEDMPDNCKLVVVELAATRREKEMLPMVMTLVESTNADLRRTGIRCLGLIGDSSAIPVLIEQLGTGNENADAARKALANLPRKDLAPALLDALQNRPELRVAVIDLLIELKCYDAIDPLIEIAVSPDPETHMPALAGLRGIADPDQIDLPRLAKLLLRSEAGRHRDEVEKTILIVCDKLPEGADRAAAVLPFLSDVDRAEAPKYLPMLGRLGGDKVLAMIDASLSDSNPEIRKAAIRALCNWPNAKPAEHLLDLAKKAERHEYRVWSLRAYIRVVSLPSERPEADTLSMLQNAFRLTDSVAERRLAIERAATVRTMETVLWVAPYLDDPELAQSACETIVELAHHRFLRQPNIDRFGPILDKVGQISKDPAIVERAKRYRLGL